MRAKLLPRLIVVLTCLVLAAPALADRKGRDRDRDDDKPDRVYEMRQKGEILPLARILEAVRKEYPGRLLKTEFEVDDGVPVYEFYILQEGGHLVEVSYDARDGRKIEEERDD